MSDWYPFRDGESLGTTGSEGGRILQDEEHGLGARITLEEGGVSAPFAVTCGIYGWMVHTHFVGDRAEADRAFGDMKFELARILSQIPLEDAPDAEDEMQRVSEMMDDFVSRFR